MPWNTQKRKTFRQFTSCITALISPSDIGDNINPVSLEKAPQCPVAIHITHLSKERHIPIKGEIRRNNASETFEVFNIGCCILKYIGKLHIIFIENQCFRKVFAAVPFSKRNKVFRNKNLLWSFKPGNFQYSIKECCFHQLRVKAIINNAPFGTSFTPRTVKRRLPSSPYGLRRDKCGFVRHFFAKKWRRAFLSSPAILNHIFR